MITRLLMAALLGLMLAGTAAAQTKKGPNGGVIVTADEHPIEFVHRGQEIVFYLGDHDGKPLLTKGKQARATVQVGKETANVTLSATEPNLFVGRLAAPLPQSARVVFSTRFEGHVLQARFVVD